MDFHFIKQIQGSVLLSGTNLIQIAIRSLRMMRRVLSHMFQGAAGAAVQNLGYTPGLVIVGLFSILILWMYANFWMTGTLFIVGGMVYFLLPDYEFFLS